MEIIAIELFGVKKNNMKINYFVDDDHIENQSLLFLVWILISKSP